MVPTSARWTAALACADATPLSTRSVEAVTPKAMPERAVDELGADADQGENQKRTHEIGLLSNEAPAGDRGLLSDAYQGRGQQRRSTADHEAEGYPANATSHEQVCDSA